MLVFAVGTPDMWYMSVILSVITVIVAVGTIDPNESRCPVPDERYDFLCDMWQPPSK